MNERIKEVEAYLGLNEGYFHNLQSEEDWPLVIKLHSLLESTCTALLTEEFGRPEALDAFASIPMGTRKSGKLAFIQSLDLLFKREIIFLEQLGWLRNKYVHNIINTEVSLVNYIESLSNSKSKEILKGLAMGCIESERNGVKLAGIESAAIYPRHTIWVSSMLVVERLHLRLIVGLERQKFMKKQIEEYLSENGPIRIRQDDYNLEKLR